MGKQPADPAIAPELKLDFDYFEVQPVEGDLHAGWKRLHQGPEIFYTSKNRGHWVFTRAEDSAAA